MDVRPALILLCGTLILMGFAVQPVHSDTIVHAPNASFYDTGMRLCDVDTNGTCHDTTYAVSIARFGLGGAAAAALSLLSFILFVPFRFLCNCCGGKKATEGACIPSKMPREYTKEEVLAVKIAVFIVVIPVIIGVAIGYQSNSGISSSVNSITSSLEQSGDSIVLSLNQLQAILTSLNLNLSTSDQATINSAVGQATSIDSHLHNAGDQVSKYDKVRNTVMIVGFAFSLSLILAGVIAAVFNMNTLAMVGGLIGLLVMTIVWISFGIHLVADKFVYDVCFDINLLSSNSSSSSFFNTGALANLWDCGSNSNFQQLQALMQKANADVVKGTCSTRSSICFNATNGHGDPHWICSPTPPCGMNTLDEVFDAQHVVIIDGASNFSVAECAVSCSNSNYKSLSESFTLALKEFDNVTSLYDNTVLPLVTCQFASQVIDGFREPLCSTLFNSLFGVAISNLIVGVFYVAFVILMIVGYKRFDSSAVYLV